MTADPPRIHVGPVAAPELIAAVTEAGGQITGPADASAVVWFGGGPERFAEIDHPGLDWVQLPSAGIEPWVAAGVLRSGTRFTSAAGAYAETVAEHALALMLGVTRRLQCSARSGRWERPVGVASLFDATVGILGAGGIGRALMRLLEPFGVRVLAVNRSGAPVAGAERTVRADDTTEVDRVLAESDHVVIAAPATAETEKLIGDRELRMLGPRAVLINVARGTLVDTGALVDALAGERIGGAGLDVTDPEPLPDGHPLFAAPNALVTPHTANPDHLLLPALARRVRANVRRYRLGEPLEGLVDLAAGY